VLTFYIQKEETKRSELYRHTLRFWRERETTICKYYEQK